MSSELKADLARTAISTYVRSSPGARSASTAPEKPTD